MIGLSGQNTSINELLNELKRLGSDCPQTCHFAPTLMEGRKVFGGGGEGRVAGKEPQFGREGCLRTHSLVFTNIAV